MEALAFRWRTILAVALATTFVATLYAVFLVKPLYESSSLLLPTKEEATSQLGSAAALLGKKVGGSEDVTLYRGLLTSRTVVNRMLFESVRLSTDSGPVEAPLFRHLGIDTGNPVRYEQGAKRLAKSISVGSDDPDAGGIIEISATASSPQLAKIVCDLSVRLGQDELRSVKARRYDMVLGRLQTAIKGARLEWDSVATALASFKSVNRSITLPEQTLQLSRLEIERQAKEQKYLLALKEYEIQSLEREKTTPPMMVLDPANQPATKKSPKKAILVAAGLFGGLFLGVLLALVSHVLSENGRWVRTIREGLSRATASRRVG